MLENGRFLPSGSTASKFDKIASKGAESKRVGKGEEGPAEEAFKRKENRFPAL